MYIAKKKYCGGGGNKMKKLLIVIICMLMIASSMMIPNNIEPVKASGGGGGDEDIGLDFGYIYNRTKDLSDIVITYPKGRAFGTPGEENARDSLEIWMNNIGLYNVTLDKIEDTTYLRNTLAGGIWSKKTDGREFTGSYWDYPVVSSSFCNNEIEDVLILGLSAGSTARSFSAAYPNVNIDGVEIDPLLLEVGKKYFNMTMPNLNPIISDGRLFVKKTQNKNDTVFLDVYHDVYIPYHMITIEFFKEIKNFFSIIGLYPPGTLVELNTQEIALVIQASMFDIKRPQVEILYNKNGEKYKEPRIVNLMEKDKKGQFKRSIIKSIPPLEKFKIPDKYS